MSKLPRISAVDFLNAAVLDKSLGKRDLRIALFLLCKRGAVKWVQLTQEEIAKELGMQQPHVATTLGRLRQLGYVGRSLTEQPRSYRLKLPNPSKQKPKPKPKQKRIPRAKPKPAAGRQTATRHDPRALRTS